MVQGAMEATVPTIEIAIDSTWYGTTMTKKPIDSGELEL